MADTEPPDFKQIKTEKIDTTDITANHITLPSTTAITRIGFLRGLGTVLLGVSALITALVAWTLSINNNDLRKESACRFEASTAVNSIGDEVEALTAEIFVAAIRDPAPGGTPNPEVQQLGLQLDEQVRLLRPAIEEREEAVHQCEE